MKNDDKQKEGTAKTNNSQEQTQSNDRNNHPSEKKETMEERAIRENWTDVVESHLGIDE